MAASSKKTQGTLGGQKIKIPIINKLQVEKIIANLGKMSFIYCEKTTFF